MYYLHTSAVMKLMTDEADSKAFRKWFTKQGQPAVSCDLLRTELLRASRRVGLRYMPRAREVLGAITLMTVPTSVFERAALLEPPELRSLDALHLASALVLGDELTAFVTYDARLAEAAARNGVPLFAPG